VSPRRSPGSPECRVTSPARGNRPSLHPPNVSGRRPSASEGDICVYLPIRVVKEYGHNKIVIGKPQRARASRFVVLPSRSFGTRHAMLDCTGKPLWEVAMKLPRRRFLHLAAGAAALPVVSQIATAQTYVRIV
jgi:hypothetical protein